MRIFRVVRLGERRLVLPGGVVCAAVAFAFVVVGFGRSPHFIPISQPATVATNQPQLSDLFNQFQSISSLSFSAAVVLEVSSGVVIDCCEAIANTAGQSIFGQLDYWAANDRYRVISYVDPVAFPGMASEVAYDGKRFQLLRSDGTLSYSSHDHATLLPVLLNPLLELVKFRYPLTDESYQFELRLKDVQLDRAPSGFFNVQWVKVYRAGQALERAEFPGGTYEGRAYVHHVYTLPGHRNMPVRIERVTTDGVVMTSAEFSDYCQVDAAKGPTYWPRQVVLRAMDSEGSDAVKITYRIDALQVDAPIPDEVFVIDPQAAARIWDDDRQEFVRP